MSTAPTPAQYSVLTVTLGQPAASATFGSLPIDFTGQASATQASAGFTVGGWVRVPTSVSNCALFASGTGSLSIWTEGGSLIAGFNGSPSTVTTGNDLSVADGSWHFLAVAFEPLAAPSTQGAMRLYVDGGLFDEAIIIPPGVSQPPTAGPQLGVTLAGGDPVDIASWMIWSIPCGGDVLDVPQWGAPATGSEAATGLVGAWDFAGGIAIDLGPNQLPVTVAASAMTWCTPCAFALGNDSGIAPAAADAINPGGAGPFTVMGWMSVPAGATGILFQTVLSDPATTTISCSATGTQITFGTAATSHSVPLSAPLAFGHVALTYDGTNLTLYLNGSVAGGPVAAALPTAAATSVAIAVNGAMDAVYFQAISIWRSALSAAEVAAAATATDSDPTGNDALAAYYSLMTGAITVTTSSGSQTENAGLVNTVTWNEASASPDILFQELRTPVPPPSPDAFTAAARNMRQAVAQAGSQSGAQVPDAPLMRLPDWYTLARRNGIDVTASPTDAELASEPYKSFAAYYETLLENLSPKLAARLRQTALRNLHIGLQLQSKGVRAGSFEITHQGGDSVVQYYGLDGPREITRYRDELLSGTALVGRSDVDIFTTILFDVIGILAAIYGFAVAGKAMDKAAVALKGILGMLGQRARNAMDAASPQAQQAAQAIFAWLYYAWSLNAFPTLVWKILSEMRWWEIALNVASLLGQLIALVASGGAYLAVKLAQMAIAFAQLISDVLKITLSGNDPTPAPTAAMANAK